MVIHLLGQIHFAALRSDCDILFSRAKKERKKALGVPTGE